MTFPAGKRATLVLPAAESERVNRVFATWLALTVLSLWGYAVGIFTAYPGPEMT